MKKILLLLVLVACYEDRHDIECYYGDNYSYCDINEYAFLTDQELHEELDHLDQVHAEEEDDEVRLHVELHATEARRILAARGYDVDE